MRDKPRQSLRFREIAMENWRNFKNAEAELQPRVFLVGPNASGKSNFLDVFKFLRDIASDGGGLVKAIADRGGVSSIRSLAARSQPAVTVEVAIGDESSIRWTYSLSFKQDKFRRPYIVTERLKSGDRVLIDRPSPDDKSDPEQLTQTYLEQVRQNTAFRELVDFFRSIRYLHVVPQIIRDPDRYRGRRHDPFGWDIFEQIASAPEKTRNAWLRRIEDKLRIAVPQLKGLELYRDVRGVPHLRSKYEHWRPQGAWQSEEVFSDGTLRLVGLLWAMLERSGPLLLEEPELSLNAHVIKHIPAMLAGMQRRSGRQIMMSTHSTDLLEDPGIRLSEVLLLEPGSEGTRISPASALRNARALLKEGIPVSEIVLPSTRPKHVDQLALQF